MDQVRKREHRDLKADGNESLKGTKYDWLRNGNNVDGRSRRWFVGLTRENLKTARAWAIKGNRVNAMEIHVEDMG